VNLEPTIAAWLALGPLELSDRVVDRARGEIHRTHQRRAWRPTWQNLGKPRARLAMAFAAGALSVTLLGIGLHLASTPPNGTRPSTSPVSSPGPVRSSIPTRSPIASSPLDGASDHFFSAGAMNGGREGHTATLLADGRVLIAGGVRQAGGGDPTRRNATGPIAAAELYDPRSNTFTATGSMTAPRMGQTATLLADGRVLIAGGYNWLRFDGQGLPVDLSSAEVYDPASGTFAATGSLANPRSSATESRLADGRVLIVGGSSFTGVQVNPSEIYDPTTGTFTAAPSFPGGKDGLSVASMLPLTDGRLLVSGSVGDPPTPSIELYDPMNGTLTVAQALTMASLETATVLADGRVLLIGGVPHGTSFVQLDLRAAVFDPATGTLRDLATPAIDFQAYTATRLADGRVFLLGITGRADRVGQLGSAEVFDPGDETFHAYGLLTSRPGGTTTLLLDGSVLIAGGGPNVGGEPAYNTAELFR
jgi:hypothetical protein